MINSSVNKQKGPSSDSQSKKTRSMDELLGVAAMEIEQLLEEEEIRELQKSQQTHRLFSEWLSSVNSSTERMGNRKRSSGEGLIGVFVMLSRFRCYSSMRKRYVMFLLILCQ